MVVSNLPVKRIVLYKHGVGFIERGGVCEGKEGLKLSFKREEMDDILKSLSVFVKGKGQVTGVSYETADDISKLLAEKAINVPDQAAMVGLLRALKGYRLKLWVPGEVVEGKVLGTDEQETSSPEGKVVGRKASVVLQSEDEKIRGFDLAGIQGLQLEDAEAREDLRFFLEAVTSERKKNMKGVTIFAEGERPELSVSYITQMPSWRVSYRLAHFQDRTLLQGWGIIDNQLDEDLKDIQLSLVAGKPISFIYDIYAPRLVHRPVVREEVRTVSAPVELEGAWELLFETEAAMAAPAPSIGPIYCAPPSQFDMESLELESGEQAAAPRARSARRMMESARVQTKSVEMGEFFRYDIENPVTVKRGQSAMVPILQGPIECRKEHVYNGAKMPRNPVVTMRLKNSTGLVLERGPIVVLDDGTYVGEAILPYTTVGTENSVAYSVDMGVVVTEKQESESRLRAIYIRQHYLSKEHIELLKTEYTIENKKTEKVQLIIEHPKGHGKLTDTPEPVEETENQFRWALELKPKSETKFNVTEAKTVSYSERIITMDHATLEGYLKLKHITKTSFEKIAGILELQKRINEIKMVMEALAGESGSMVQEQDRLRKNLGALGTSSQEAKLRATIVSKLEAQEKRLDEIKAQVEKLQGEVRALDKEINARLGALAQ